MQGPGLNCMKEICCIEDLLNLNRMIPPLSGWVAETAPSHAEYMLGLALSLHEPLKLVHKI